MGSDPYNEGDNMRKQYIFKLIKIACACIAVSAACTITGLAGHWMANETGYWYVHDDGTYPQYAWEWIDTDGDGIYMCYAFDERGYLYTNTVTPDGYVVGPDGSWYSGIVPMTRAFINGASIVPTSMGSNVNTNDDTYAYSADGMQLITQRYSTPKKNATTSGSSGKSGSSSSKSSKSTTVSGVSSSDIVTKIYKTGKSDNTSSSGSDSTATNTSSTTTSTYSEPDVNNASDDSFGPGRNIPKNYSSQTVSPTADTREYAPTNNVKEREGYEDADQSDDDEDE